jgi:hypothetical protein
LTSTAIIAEARARRFSPRLWKELKEGLSDLGAAVSANQYRGAQSDAAIKENLND